jgi:hypothetical protein
MKPDTAVDEEDNDMFVGKDEAPCESPTANKGNINPNFMNKTT